MIELLDIGINAVLVEARAAHRRRQQRRTSTLQKGRTSRVLLKSTCCNWMV